MKPAPATALDLWEAGLPRTPAARAVLLLEATGHVDPGGWPVGRGHRALLEAWCAAGRGLAAVVDCPGCDTALDVAVDPRALPAGASGPVEVRHGGYTVTAHPPTIGELAELSPTDDVRTLRRQLLARCVDRATTTDGDPVATEDLPDHVVDLVDEALAEADPASDPHLVLTCPECGTTWSDTLDVTTFAWSAVEGAARRLAGDVHTLADAYGWGEAEILALSPFRRHLYLSAVRS